MIRHYQARATLVEAGGEEMKLEREIAMARYERNLSQELRALERSTAVMLRNEDKINDEIAENDRARTGPQRGALSEHLAFVDAQRFSVLFTHMTPAAKKTQATASARMAWGLLP